MTASDLSPLLDHLTAPRGRGRLAGHPHAGTAGGAPCGDLIRIAVSVEGDRVMDAGFDAGGCAAARAAGSATVELVKGASFLDAARTTPERISEELGGLSAERMHAAQLAADALHRALGATGPRLDPDPNRTLIAMSGGVDSAVAAQLALERGHDAIAVTLELWADPGTDGTKSCCSPQAVIGARALAHRMGLPHVTLDVRDGFRDAVVHDFIDEHAAGRTPNPCVRCNGLVRFGAMLELAHRLGAARLATGHYARVARDEHGPLVRAGADPGKDQSYMLARLRPADLERLWFPLGDLTKPRVRELARAAELPVAERPESQDLCFLAGTRQEEFLRRHGAGRLEGRRGEIVDSHGRTLGEHDGQHRFTVGQRRGIGVAASEPLYVLRKHAGSGRVVVGPRDALAVTTVSVAGAMLHRDATTVDRVKLRYRSSPVGCRVAGRPPAGRHRTLELELDQPVLGVAPGQTACLMRGETVVGSATIAPTRRVTAPGPEMEDSRMPADRIELTTPVGRDWEAVIRMVLGGIADRLDLGFDELDDLQLAVERLLAEGDPEDPVTLSFELVEGGVRTRIGPLRDAALAAALQGPQPGPGELTLPRILSTVVDSYGVESAEDGRLVVRLEKAVRG